MVKGEGPGSSWDVIYVMEGEAITERLANSKLQVYIFREERYVEGKRRKDRRDELGRKKNAEINRDEEEEDK